MFILTISFLYLLKLIHGFSKMIYVSILGHIVACHNLKIKYLLISELKQQAVVKSLSLFIKITSNELLQRISSHCLI